MKGFPGKWCQWIDSFVRGDSVGAKVNDDVGHYFQSRKRLQQGDPLSPILFSILADLLAVSTAWAKEANLVGGLILHLYDGGVSILQYADDTIIFMEHDMEKAKNMKLILCLFEQLSCLKINFHKRELFSLGKPKRRRISISSSLVVILAPSVSVPWDSDALSEAPE